MGLNPLNYKETPVTTVKKEILLFEYETFAVKKAKSRGTDFLRKNRR
jgi:hypothetical protein